MPIVKKQLPPPKNPTTQTSPSRATASKEDFVRPESVWDMVDRVAALIYGKSATGKTTLAATFPDPILWMLCSGGNLPGELKSIDTPENRKRITPVVIDSSMQIVQQLERFDGKYKTAVLDHTSGFCDLKIKELLGLADIPLSKAKRAGKGESWSLVSQQQYGQLAIECKEIFRAMLNLRANVVLIAQERTFGGEDANSDSEVIRPFVGAALTPSLVGWLNPAVDYIMQTYLRPKITEKIIKVGNQEVKEKVRGKGVEYCLRTEPHDSYITKFRLPRGRSALPECIVDPSYDKIVKLIQGT